MRNVTRIDDITNQLNQVWKKFPDFRFWQLISLILSEVPEEYKGRDPFFFEESDWKIILDALMKRYSEDE